MTFYALEEINTGIAMETAHKFLTISEQYDEYTADDTGGATYRVMEYHSPKEIDISLLEGGIISDMSGIRII